MTTWPMWRFDARREWADTAAKQLGLPTPVIPEY